MYESIKKYKTFAVFVMLSAFIILTVPIVKATGSLADGTYTIAVNVYKAGTTEASRSAGSVKTPATLIVSGGSIQAQAVFNNTSMTDIAVGGKAAEVVSTAGEWTTYQFPVASESATVPVSVKVPAMGGAQVTIDLAFRESTAVLVKAAEKPANTEVGSEQTVKADAGTNPVEPGTGSDQTVQPNIGTNNADKQSDTGAGQAGKPDPDANQAVQADAGLNQAGQSSADVNKASEADQENTHNAVAHPYTVPIVVSLVLLIVLLIAAGYGVYKKMKGKKR